MGSPWRAELYLQGGAAGQIDYILFFFFVFVGKMLLSNCIITTFISYILKLYSETGDKIWEPLL